MSKDQSENDNRKKGGFLRVLLSLMFIVIAAGLLVFNHYYGLLKTEDGEKKPIVVPSEIPDPEELYEKLMGQTDDGVSIDENGEIEMIELDSSITNIMLAGVDSLDNDFSGRSDSMILITINSGTKEIILTSFLRDMYVSIPGYGNNRLNAAYAWGQSTLLDETIGENFGIPINNNITVNFYLVRDFVDALGGVDIELTAAEIEVMNGYIVSQTEEFGTEATNDQLPAADGVYHINGNQALAYARVRYIGTDFARTGRQRLILSACFDKLKKMSLTEIKDIATEFLPRVETDMNEVDALKFVGVMLTMNDYEVTDLTIPAQGTWNDAIIDEMAVLEVNKAKNSEIWLETVTGKR